MSTKLLLAVSFLFVAAAPAALAASVSVDGVSCGSVLRWEGGDPRAQVVTISLATASGPGSKQIATITYDPLLLEFPLPPPAAIADWINDLNANGHSRKNLLLTDYDGAGAPVASIEATGAVLTEVRFPAFDAAASAAGSVVLVFAVEQTRPVTATTQSGASQARGSTVDSKNFRLKIDGLDTNQVSRIESLTVSQRASSEQVGATRDYSTQAGTTEFSNLTFTIADSAAAGWKAWFNDFAINGNNGDGSEKSGSIDFSDATGKGVPFGLQFSHVGIVRVTRLPAAANTVARDQVELYFEHLTVGAPSASASQSAQSTSSSPPAAAETAAASTTPPATTPAPAAATPAPAAATPTPAAATPTPAAATPVLAAATPVLAAATPVLAAATPAASALAAAPAAAEASALSRAVPAVTQPIPGATAALNPAAATPAGPAMTQGLPVKPADASTPSTTTSPADQGSRDPVDFPRVTGLTRVSYSGTFQKAYTSESATYTSTEDVQKLMARISDAAQAAGWEQLTLAEQGAPPNGRTVSASWSKPQVQAQVSCSDRREGGTTVNVQVYKQKPATN